ncbi:MAG TPA: hypothetical protein VMS17_09945, partial [Gemmataceae bacterium]|nr:hypothetical protein [Gemmataceae bacterium]
VSDGGKTVAHASGSYCMSNIVYFMALPPPITGVFRPPGPEKHNKINQNRLTAIVNVFILAI